MILKQLVFAALAAAVLLIVPGPSQAQSSNPTLSERVCSFRGKLEGKYRVYCWSLKANKANSTWTNPITLCGRNFYTGSEKAFSDSRRQGLKLALVQGSCGSNRTCNIICQL